MIQQKANKWFFVYVTNTWNIIPLFGKKVISHKPNVARTCKNKFYENKIKLNWLNLLNFSIEV